MQTEDTYKCIKCGELKEINQFYINSTKRGHRTECIDCNLLRQRSTKYNIDIDRLNTMLSNGCAVCGTSDSLIIDHDHTCCDYKGSCGECIRGILCSTCNVGIGMLQDDISIMYKAIEYLRSNDGNPRYI